MTENKTIDINALRGAFKEGATPNELDYGTLIDLASVGARPWGCDHGCHHPCSRAWAGSAGGKLAVKAARGCCGGEGWR
ncbi:hypothetical protein CEQ31_026605 [Serratia odorifera]|nr:hypothetical protein CEQ31_026605 [Serratia odorifera]